MGIIPLQIHDTPGGVELARAEHVTTQRVFAHSSIFMTKASLAKGCQESGLSLAHHDQKLS